MLVLRRETERPEAVEAGTVRIAGTEEQDIVDLARELIDSAEAYAKMVRAVNPYGDGRACRRIADGSLYHFGMTDRPPETFH